MPVLNFLCVSHIRFYHIVFSNFCDIARPYKLLTSQYLRYDDSLFDHNLSLYFYRY